VFVVLSDSISLLFVEKSVMKDILEQRVAWL